MDVPDIRSAWDLSDPAATEERFRDMYETTSSDDGRAEILTQIARTKGLRKQFDEAHAILDDVEPMLRDGAPRPRVRYCLERGRAFNSFGTPEKATPLFQQAYDVAQAADLHGLAVDALHMLAIAAKAPREQLRHTEAAIKYIDECGDPSVRGWLGPLLNNSGWTYHDELHEYEKALEVFTKGAAFRDEQGVSEQSFVAHYTVGRALRSLERYEDALTKQGEVRAMREDAGAKPSGFVFEEIGECELALGRTEQEVQPHFAEAWSLLKDVQWIKNSQPERYERIRRLAGVSE